MKKTIIMVSIAALAACSSPQGNSLLTKSEAEYGIPEFDKFKSSDYMPAFEFAIHENRKNIDEIIKSKEKPTFNNVIASLELSGTTLDQLSAIFFTLADSDADSIMQDTKKKVSPMLTDLSGYVYMNDTLFQKVKTLHDNMSKLNLSREQQMVLKNYYTTFVRGGALLNAEQKKLLLEVEKELSLKSIEFADNVLADNNAFELLITNKADLAGLPEGSINAAAEAAKAKGKKGWLFTLDSPSRIPLLQFADNRALREKMYKAYITKGNNENKNNNKAIVKRSLELRLKKAQLLGFKTYADYALDNTMAHSYENAHKLLVQLFTPATKKAKEEVAEMQQIINEENKNAPFKLEAWDWWYYTEKLRAKKYAMNTEELRQYFALDSVRNGAFMVANKLYGITFKEIPNAPIYNPEVKVYDVLDSDGTHLAVYTTDYFPRATKRSGAWMTNFRDSYNDAEGNNIRPIVANVCNFTRPSGKTPALLDLDETRTLFHEFGHALHGMLTKAKYKSVSGTSVKRDFVELFSQINELWSIEPEVLKMYAKNWKTGEPIPDALIEKMQQTATFNLGFETSELVAAALLDMEMHNRTDYSDFDCDKAEEQIRQSIGLIPEIAFRYRPTYFSHVFSGGYAVGYYGYLWAEMLDTDAFEEFKKNGIFDPTTAKKFRVMLQSGGSEEPATLYRQFRGQDPTPEAMLRSRGLK